MGGRRCLPADAALEIGARLGSLSARIRELASGIAFRIRLTPKGRGDRIDGWARDAQGAWLLKARVAAPAEDGKANASLLALLSRELHIPRSRLTIASGETARLKTIVATGDPRELTTRLSAFGESK